VTTGTHQEERHRHALVDKARKLYDRGLIAGIDGNLSVRFGGRWILATPSGVPKGDLGPEDLVLLDLGPAAARGGPMSDQPRVARARRGRIPSSELAIHLAPYAVRPDVHAVVHAHPPTAVGLTMGEEQVRLDICPESVVFLGDVGFAPYATPGTLALPASMTPFIPRCDTILLSRHGAVTFGPDLDLAYQRMESLEHVAKIFVAARQLGPVQPLPAEEQDRLLALAGRTRLQKTDHTQGINVDEVVSQVLSRLSQG
jgi:L-fuculose-phosphate aldolase